MLRCRVEVKDGIIRRSVEDVKPTNPVPKHRVQRIQTPKIAINRLTIAHVVKLNVKKPYVRERVSKVGPAIQERETKVQSSGKSSHRHFVIREKKAKNDGVK